jgi:hypothetical protein
LHKVARALLWLVRYLCIFYLAENECLCCSSSFYVMALSVLINVCYWGSIEWACVVHNLKPFFSTRITSFTVLMLWSLTLFQILKEEGYMKPIVCSYYINLSISCLKISICRLVYLLEKFGRLFNVCCTSGLSNFKSLRGRIVPWIHMLRRHYKNYIHHCTNTEICLATIRSMKHKQTSNSFT